MYYHMPVHVYAENDCVRKHSKELAALGRKALIVTGRRSATLCGALDDVTNALDAEGVESCHFSEVEENPSTGTVMRIRDFGLKSGADFVIGIGGGSPLDAAKAAALMMASPDRDADMLYDPDGGKAHLPVAAVPTTCGTGSEVTAVSVLTNHAKKTKGSIPYRIWPALALIDGAYLASAPPKLIRHTSVDALCHLMECGLSSKGTELSRMPVAAGLMKWAETKDILDGTREPAEDDYGKLMLSSAFAGMAIAQSGTSLPHALGYILTYDTGLPHGPACGYFLPRFLREAPAELRDPLLRMAGFADCEELEAYLARVLDHADIPEQVLARTYRAVLEAPAKMRSAAFAVDAEVLHRITYGA